MKITIKIKMKTVLVRKRILKKEKKKKKGTDGVYLKITFKNNRDANRCPGHWLRMIKKEII